jgi:rhodanese-related sulfurtransferase
LFKFNKKRTSRVTFEGVASAEDLEAFAAEAGDRLLVVDVRSPAADGEDVKSTARTALPSETYRPKAINLVWDRTTDQMPLPSVPKDTPIITHCGAGSRGQMAKEFLEKNGFVKVINGGGPKETDCWAVYGEK